MDSTEINLCMYGQMIFHKAAKIIQWVKEQYFRQLMLGKTAKELPWTLTLHCIQKSITKSDVIKLSSYVFL